MTPFTVALLSVTGIAILLLPRPWLSFPLLVGACCATRAQAVDIGPYTFTVMRLLILVGLTRALTGSDRFLARRNPLDRLIVAWGAWMILSAFLHNHPAAQLVTRLGLVFDGWGLYFLLRFSCRSPEDLLRQCVILAIVLIPIAAGMLVEKATMHNVFSILAGASDTPQIREGRLRALGPFAHPILAGSVGSVSVPLFVGLWAFRKRVAVLGIVACLAIVYASASSGPILSLLAGVLGLLLWRCRNHMRTVAWLIVAGYVALDIVMKDPAYFIIARIDLAGGSTGWHRAYLIQSALGHFSEWWLAGTDYTRHWMPTGVSWSGQHTDVTNHYLLMAVFGGVPLALLFIAILRKGFILVGQALRDPELPMQYKWLFWTCGAALFSHAVTCLSVAYFDQSIAFLYLALVAVNAAHRSDHAIEVVSEAVRTRTPWSQGDVPGRWTRGQTAKSAMVRARVR